MTGGAVVVGFLVCMAAGYFLQPSALKAWRSLRAWKPHLTFTDTGIEVYWLSSLGAAYKTQEEALRHLQDEYAIARRDLRQSIQEWNYVSDAWVKAKSAASGEGGGA